MAKATATQIYADIINGAYDNELAMLQTALTNRRQMKEQQLIYELQPGQRVWFNNRVNPKYLFGKQVVVKRVLRKRVEVEFVNLSDSGRFGKEVKAHAGILTTVDPNK